MSDYPEHDKMQAAQPAAQTIGDFLEWLLESTPYLIAEHNQLGRLEPISVNFEKLLYEYFEIDRSVVEAEKEKMLELQRAANSEASRCPQCRQVGFHKMDCSETR